MCLNETPHMSMDNDSCGDGNKYVCRLNRDACLFLYEV